MLQTQQNRQVPAFSYEVFDRQLDNFAMMLKVLMDGWEDYSSQEMTFDIHSLCTKASRLCYLADQDLALQHTDVSHHRKEQNETYFTSFELIITTQFTKFMKKSPCLGQGWQESRRTLFPNVLLRNQYAPA